MHALTHGFYAVAFLFEVSPEVSSTSSHIDKTLSGFIMPGFMLP